MTRKSLRAFAKPLGAAVVLLCVSTYIVGSRQADKPIPLSPESEATVMNNIDTLSGKRIFFGHKSVGGNILDGVRDIQKEPVLPVVALESPKAIETGEFGLFHAPVGTNSDINSKIDAFTSMVRGGIGGKADIACFKFCYIDITRDTDVATLFKQYKEAMAALANEYPDTKFVHLTIPLTAPQRGLKPLVKTILGRGIDVFEDNKRREEFNQMLRQEYAGKAPVFDLAAVESTKEDGAKSLVQKGGQSVPGHIRTITRTGVKESCFWHPSYPTPAERQSSKWGIEEAVEATRASLEDATRLRMLRADVPVGSYLSGDLDSSLIAALGQRVKGEKFCTFSLRFEDAEYDETSYQRAMVEQIGSDHKEVCVSRKDIANAFPTVIGLTERPILRTAPVPMFLLSRLVHQAGIKVVLTGEGADEMFAGYDIFREARLRRFWARQPLSENRPRLLEHLYPYLARSPVSQQAVARKFFGRNLDKWREPGFGHAPRWEGTAALKRLFAAGIQEAVSGLDAQADLLATLPEEFSSWTCLAQDQYLEVRTLLSGYLLSSQGDRMLMGNSVEGRFPFLDKNVVELANSLPDAVKLNGIDEKHVLKRAARGLVPDEILSRPKQPYRAPDAISFVGPDAPEWVADALNTCAVADAGVFDPAAVQNLYGKCKARQAGGQFSNADNMALVGILSTQLLHEQFVKNAPDPGPAVPMKTVVDLLSEIK